MEPASRTSKSPSLDENIEVDESVPSASMSLRNSSNGGGSNANSLLYYIILYYNILYHIIVHTIL